MYVVVYVGDIIKKRIKVIEEIEDIKLYIFDDTIDLIEKLNGTAVDIFIANNKCVCSTIKDIIMYKNTPVMMICDNVNNLPKSGELDLIITNKTTNTEFRKNIEVLLKLKKKNDENIKEEILHSLKVKHNEIKINNIFNAMNEGLIITNENGHITTINNTAKLVCKYNKGEIKHIDDIFNLFVNNIRIRIFSETLNNPNKIILNNGAKINTSYNKYINVTLNSSKLYDSNANFIGILVIYQDISKEYKIMTKLQDSEEKYKRIYNNAPDIIYTHDIDGYFTSMNKSSDFGYKLNEVVGHHIGEFMDEKNLKKAHSHILAKINKNEYISEYEIDVLHKKGYPITLEIKSILEKNKYGEYEIFSIARNITEKIENRNQIKLEQERYKQMFFNNNSSVIIFKYINDCFHIIDYNNKGELIDKIKVDNFKNKDVLKLDPIYYQIVEYLKIVHKGKRKNYRVDEFKFILKNDEIYLDLFIYKLKHSDEIIMIYDNITEFKLLINQYEEAKNKAKESDHLKSTFLSNISHEIRTPMNAIKGFSGQLKDNISIEDKRKSYADIIYKSSENLLTILNDILEISLIENGTINIINDYFYVNDLLDELKQKTFAILRAKKKSYILLNVIKFDLNIEMCADIRRIRQILLNIIDNAIKFTNKGTIEIKAELHKDYVKFDIKDTGIGIRNDEIDKVCDRFYKVHNKKLTSGTGLGLSISKQLSNKLGGDLKITSKVDFGTIVSVKIPIYSEKTIHKETKKKAKVNWSSSSILIVEDKEINYRLLELYLEHTQVNINRAEDGSEFYKKFNEKIDLILLDIQLPDTNGFELLKWIRSNNNDIPIIIQTAFASDDDEQKAYELGANGFMTKPIKKKTLLDEVSKYFNI